VALHGNISPPVRVTDLVNASKDAASLALKKNSALKKNFLLGGAGFL